VLIAQLPAAKAEAVDEAKAKTEAGVALKPTTTERKLLKVRTG